MNLSAVLADYEHARRYGEERSPLDLPDDREAIWYLLKDAELLQAAANDLVADIKAALAERIDENESVRFGDKIYKMSPKRTVRILDPDALAEWLGDDWAHVVPFSPSVGDKLKVGGFRAVCERRGVPYETVRDTFLSTTWGDRALSEVPVDKAPKYAASLEHGESTYSKRRASG